MTAEVKKPTIGEEAYKRLMSADTQEVGETSSEMKKDYETELMKCILNYKQNRLFNDTPFYAVVLYKKERIMHNVVRRYFMARESEPTPTYDQTVYEVNHKTLQITFKWQIPDVETYLDMLINGAYYPIDKQDLVGFCRAMKEGRLAEYQKVNLLKVQ